jgi:hypothetical protein
MTLSGHAGIHVTTERRGRTIRESLRAEENFFRRGLRFPLRILFRDATVCWQNLERPLPGDSWNKAQNAVHRGDLR